VKLSRKKSIENLILVGLRQLRALLQCPVAVAARGAISPPEPGLGVIQEAVGRATKKGECSSAESWRQGAQQFESRLGRHFFHHSRTKLGTAEMAAVLRPSKALNMAGWHFGN
jgi:hypothetical protein